MLTVQEPLRGAFVFFTSRSGAERVSACETSHGLHRLIQCEYPQVGVVTACYGAIILYHGAERIFSIISPSGVDIPHGNVQDLYRADYRMSEKLTSDSGRNVRRTVVLT